MTETLAPYPGHLAQFSHFMVEAAEVQRDQVACLQRPSQLLCSSYTLMSLYPLRENLALAKLISLLLLLGSCYFSMHSFG